MFTILATAAANRVRNADPASEFFHPEFSSQDPPEEAIMCGRLVAAVANDDWALVDALLDSLVGWPQSARRKVLATLVDHVLA